MLRAIVFDFDGTIVDTEEIAYGSWVEIYAQFGQHLELAVWSDAVGRASDGFDPFAHLESLLGRELPREEMLRTQHVRHVAMADATDARPGVRELIGLAQREGLALGVASSSHHAWVEHHLERLGLRSAFGAVACVDDTGKGKPDPALYRVALQRLGVAAEEAVAIEDSPNGALAAQGAGMAGVVVVPNDVTSGFSFPSGVVRWASLDGVTPADIAAVMLGSAGA